MMNTRIRSLVTMAGCGLVLGLSLPAGAAGQLRILPQAGLYAPVSDLGAVSDAGDARTLGQREASFAYGVAAEIGPSDGTAFRLTGLFGSDGEVPVAGVGCSEAECDVRSTVVSLTGSVVFRPIPRIILVQPYLVAGGGLKRYDYDFGDDTSVRGALGDDANELTGLFGVGVDWTLGIVNGTLELSDHVSGSVLDDGGDTQHDLFLTLGLYLG